MVTWPTDAKWIWADDPDAEGGVRRIRAAYAAIRHPLGDPFPATDLLAETIAAVEAATTELHYVEDTVLGTQVASIYQSADGNVGRHIRTIHLLLLEPSRIVTDPTRLGPLVSLNSTGEIQALVMPLRTRSGVTR